MTKKICFSQWFIQVIYGPRQVVKTTIVTQLADQFVWFGGYPGASTLISQEYRWKNYILDTAGLLRGIEKYSPGILRQRSSSPKFQVHNTALITVQQPESFSRVSRTGKWDRLVESAIGAHLLNHSLVKGFNLFYWRHRNDEIDFVLEYQGKVIGIVVKSSASKRTSGMAAFTKQFNPYKVLMVGDSGIPWQEFFEMDPAELFIN